MLVLHLFVVQMISPLHRKSQHIEKEKSLKTSVCQRNPAAAVAIWQTLVDLGHGITQSRPGKAALSQLSKEYFLMHYFVVVVVVPSQQHTLGSC